MRKHDTSVTVTEPITLEDLRWLVGQCKDMDPTTRVSTKEHKSHNAREWDAAEITVHGNISQ
jgi:hypothetical protein